MTKVQGVPPWGPVDLVLGHLSLQVTMETAGAHKILQVRDPCCHSRDLRVLCKAGRAEHPRALAASLWGCESLRVLQGSQVGVVAGSPYHIGPGELCREEKLSLPPACSGYTASSTKLSLSLVLSHLTWRPLKLQV